MAAKKAATKSEIIKELVEKTGLTKKEIVSVFDTLTAMITHSISKKGPGMFTIPGLIKVKKLQKKATKERQGRNPQTGEPITIKAKPARTVARAYPLKLLKEAVM